jgi:UMF1 family MFS transporter
MGRSISWATVPAAEPQVPPSAPAGRAKVLAWALWDCGSTGLNAIVVTFVFAVYLTGAVGSDLPGATTPTSWLGRAMTVAGLLVALLAPVTGVWVDDPRRRRVALTVLTGVAVLLTCAMSLIRDDHRYLLPGLVLLACTAACSDLASVPYNAMLSGLSTPQNSGRISGFGWAMGYSGSVLLLLAIYLGFISGDGDTRGLLGFPVADGQNVRAAMLLAAAWFLLFALPLLLTVRIPDNAAAHPRPVGVFGAYRRLWSEIVGEWRRDRNIVYYLLASAVFRDGLAGVFAFGAVIGVSVYGISEADVLLFGVSACVVAAVGAVIGGLLDDRVGSKPVIVVSLAAMIVVGLTLLTLSGALAFWVCGLLLCLFIGPTQSSARTQLLRMAVDGKEGVAFGLYTTTGRAVSFLAPWLFFTFIDLFGADRAGMGGLCVVLAAGLAAMLAVRVPHHPATVSAGADAVGQP